MWAKGRRVQKLIGVGVVLACLGATTRPAAGADCATPAAAGHLSAAETHLTAGRYRDAISEFNRALLAAPDCDRAKQGIIEANRALLQRRTAADTPGAVVSRHISLGGTAFEAGDYARAIREWEEALALDPDNRVAASLIASAREAQVDQLIEEGSRLFAAGDVAGALQQWEQARELDPFNATLDDLMIEGRAESDRKQQTRNQEQLDSTMRRLRDEVTRMRTLPYEDMTASGLRVRDASERPEEGAAYTGRARGTIIAELRNPVSLDFEETDLRAVLRFLSEVTGINILIDEAVFDELGEEDPDDEEAEPQIKVTIFVNELPLESALKGMLRQHGLDFQIQRDFLYISTPEVLRASSFEQLEIRYYRLRDAARVSLPKFTAQAEELGQAVGEAQQVSFAGGELVRRLQQINPTTVQDSPDDPVNWSVARLMSLIRNFVPTVVETPTVGGDRDRQQQRTVQRTEDTVVGGWRRISEASTLVDAESVTRERVWDSASREVLSRLEYDPTTHTLIAKNTPSNLDMLEEMLDRLDKPTKQVLIESRFLQVDMRDIQRVDTDLSLLGFGTGTLDGSGRLLQGALTAATGVPTVDPSLGGLGGLFVDGIFGGGDLGESFGKGVRLAFRGNDNQLVTAAIDLLTQLDNTELVSAPRITTLNGKPAAIQDIRTTTFLTDVDFTNEVIQPPPGSNAQPTIVVETDPTFTQVAVGVTMTVTPLVLEDNTIRLVLLPDVSNLGETNTFAVPFFNPQTGDEGFVSVEQPEILRQSLYTNVQVADGETLVLGGLVDTEAQFQERSVPFFRSLPVLGNFFRSTGEIIRRSQLLIFIKCNIISPEGLSYVRLK